MSNVHTIKFPVALEKCYAEACSETTFRKCILCKRPCCPQHKSHEDADYCQDCLSPKTTEMVEEPLVDTNGVTHVGRVLRPVGPYYVTFPGTVHEMSNEQLDLCIEEYAARVHEARAALDRANVRLTVAQSEKADRVAQQARTRQRQPVITLTTPDGSKVQLGAASSAKHRAQQMLDKLQAAGLSVDDILKALQGIKDKRNNKP